MMKYDKGSGSCTLWSSCVGVGVTAILALGVGCVTRPAYLFAGTVGRSSFPELSNLSDELHCYV